MPKKNNDDYFDDYENDEKRKNRKKSEKKKKKKKSVEIIHEPEKTNRKSLKPEIISIIFIGIGVLLITSIFSGNGISGEFSENAVGYIGGIICMFIKGIMGIGAYIFPFIIIFFSVRTFFSDDNKIEISNIIISIILLFITISLIHIVWKKDDNTPLWYFQHGSALNGGFIGALIGNTLYSLLGFGTYIIFTMFGIILIILLTKKSFMYFLKDFVKKIYEQIKNDDIYILDEKEGFDEFGYNYFENEDYENEEYSDFKKKTEQKNEDNELNKTQNITYHSRRKNKLDMSPGRKRIEELQKEKNKNSKKRKKVTTIEIKKHKEIKEDKPKISLFIDDINKHNQERNIDVSKNEEFPKFLRQTHNSPKEKENDLIINGVYSNENEIENDFNEYIPNDSENTLELPVDSMTLSTESNDDYDDFNNLIENIPYEYTIDLSDMDLLNNNSEKEQKNISNLDKDNYNELKDNYSENENQNIILHQAGPQKLFSERISSDDEKQKYKYPKLSFLKKNYKSKNQISINEIRENSKILINTLKSFNIDASMLEISRGPTVTRYEIAPGKGIKISRIINLSDNLALSLAAQSIRIEAPIPGKAAVGIEIPNKEIETVHLSEVICDETFQKFPSKAAFGLGKDIAGNVITADITKMPHILIAGATGSGKSVCINTLIVSILYKATPEEVKLLMVDPKVVELNVYNGIPHLIIPVVTDPQKAAGALNWAVSEMMDRYSLFAEINVRSISSYNEHMKEIGKERLPHIIIIIDELADLMMVSAKEVEASIVRLAQLARAAGIHLVIATQRPSVDIITGIIKANIPSRIAFAVSSSIDSRTIIDSGGAEKLLGKGDMLFKSIDMLKPLRIQGAFISDKEVEEIVKFIKEKNPITYDEDLIKKITSSKIEKSSENSEMLNNELTEKALNFVVEKGSASVSIIQKQFGISRNNASKIIDELENRGIISSASGTNKSRTVLMDKYQLKEYNERHNLE